MKKPHGEPDAQQAVRDRSILNRSFSLDFTQDHSCSSENSKRALRSLLDAPVGECDDRRGLRFPIHSGGFAFASESIISDDRGALEINFTPHLNSLPGTLVQAWGQYDPLLSITSHGVLLNVYNTRIPLYVRWREGEEYSLLLSWHHKIGIALTITDLDGVEQTLTRRLEWRAYRQQFVPFAIGGEVSGQRYCNWNGTFHGFIRAVQVWPEPLEVPGAVNISPRGEPIVPPFPPCEGIEVLELYAPPIQPNPFQLVSLPECLDELRRTREVARLDEVLCKAKNESELFAALTHHVSTMWPHCQYWPFPKDEPRHIFEKRGHEMIPEIEAGRMGGMCGGYAHVMEELFWSLGYDARRIQVSGHSSFEAYSNECDKWIVCDASWNTPSPLAPDTCFMLAAAGGEFLNTADLIRRYEALTYNADAMRDVRVMACREENLHDVGYNALIEYFDRIGIQQDKNKRSNSTHLWYLRKPERGAFKAGGMDVGSDDVLVDSLEVLYPSRNRVRTEFSWCEKGEVLSVQAKPAGVTFFDTILQATDDDEWKPCEENFDWRLHVGVNSLKLRTRNELGALGHPFHLTLWKAPVTS